MSRAGRKVKAPSRARVEVQLTREDLELPDGRYLLAYGHGRIDVNPDA